MPSMVDAMAAYAARLPLVLPGPMQTLSWRPKLIPGEKGATSCSCWDSVGKRATDPSDPQCFGTGVVGGYGPTSQLTGRILLNQSLTRETPAGYLETTTGVVLFLLSSAPLLKRDDLVIVSPDPYGTDAPDRRYTVGGVLEPMEYYGRVFYRRYQVWPAELESVVYRVPMANPATIPDDQWGTL